MPCVSSHLDQMVKMAPSYSSMVNKIIMVRPPFKYFIMVVARAVSPVMSQQEALRWSQSEISMCCLVIVILILSCSSILFCHGAGRADPVRVSAEQRRAQRSDEEDAVRNGQRAAIRDS